MGGSSCCPMAAERGCIIGCRMGASTPPTQSEHPPHTLVCADVARASQGVQGAQEEVARLEARLASLSSVLGSGGGGGGGGGGTHNSRSYAAVVSPTHDAERRCAAAGGGGSSSCMSSVRSCPWHAHQQISFLPVPHSSYLPQHAQYTRCNRHKREQLLAGAQKVEAFTPPPLPAPSRATLATPSPLRTSHAPPGTSASSC